MFDNSSGFWDTFVKSSFDNDDDDGARAAIKIQQRIDRRQLVTNAMNFIISFSNKSLS